MYSGPVDTPMLDKLIADAGLGNSVTNTYKNLPLQKMGTAEEMSKTICFALSDDASNTTGSVFSVDGGAAC